MKDKLIPYMTESEIKKVIGALAEQINQDYAHTTDKDPLVLVVTLKGAAYFAADLSRELTIPVFLDYIRATSYGSATKSSGNVRILKDVESHLENKHVLVLDEIVDSGYTIDFLLSMFSKKNPASIKVCTLLSKPSRREVDVPIDYVGKDVEDKFLIGYGLDFDEKFRHLKDIYYLE